MDAYEHMDADELRAEIAHSLQANVLLRQRSQEIHGEYAAAEERQRLRRELETAREVTNKIGDEIYRQEVEVEQIDADYEGSFQPQAEFVPARQVVTQSHLNQQVVVDPALNVAKTSQVWTIKGMSWLIAAMAQDKVGTHASRASFYCGGNLFDLVYNPTAAEQGGASLSLRHYDQGSGLTCRYQFLILHADGDYRPWGEQGEVVLPDDIIRPEGALYGPDTPAGAWTVNTVDRHERQAEDGPIGVFGLDHHALTASEWVTDDCLSVKVDLEVRRDRDEGEDREWWMMTPRAPAETPADRIKVPEAVLAPNLGALFGDGAHSDVVFRVDGERVPAHVCILAAR